MGEDEAIANKRVSDRRRMLKSGRIVFSQRSTVIDCTVRNVSKTGAMLRVANSVTVPQEFELWWDGNVQRCTVLWRKRDALGVKFDT